MKSQKVQERDWTIAEARRKEVNPEATAPPPVSRMLGLSITPPPTPPGNGGGLLGEAEHFAGPWQRYAARRDLARQLIDAQRQKLRMVIEAGLKCEAESINLRVEKVMAELRAERLEFLAKLGVQEDQNLMKLSEMKAQIFADWFEGLQVANMPEFMRHKLLDLVMRRWDKEMNELFRLDE
jgi:hypothetical protein